jgi:hypothetical protein
MEVRGNVPNNTQGIVYDVTGNKAYQPGGAYHGEFISARHSIYKFLRSWQTKQKPHPVFAGKDASRALGKTSTKPEDVSSEWQDLPDKEKGTLNDWVTFFSKRYNVVGRVEGATNLDS